MADYKCQINDAAGWEKFYNNAMPLVGDVRETFRSTPPTNWLLCQGQTLNRTTYAALFAAIGSICGPGDGSTTFVLPDARKKVTVGYDSTDTDFNAIGKTGGEKTHTLNVNEIPSHAHVIPNASGVAGSDYIVSLAAGQTRHNSGITGYGNGGDGPHNNLQPYIVVNKMVYTGV